MKILIIGDVYAKPGREILAKQLPALQKAHDIDFTIVNCENSTHGRGMNYRTYKELRQLPIDVMTMGNHTFGQNEIFDFIDESPEIVRPANGHPQWPGRGYRFFEVGNRRIAVVNLLGGAVIQSHVNPFVAFDELLPTLQAEADIIIVDFHAELTSEKIAFGYHAMGRAQIVFGTHTHVQTADARILEGKTAYITDVGMTGPLDGVIGVKKEIIVQRFIKNYPARFEVAAGRMQLNGIVVTLNETNSPIAIETIHVEG